MRKFLIFILFLIVFTADSIFVPIFLNSRGGFLTVIFILTWLISKKLNNKSLLGLVLFFLVEIFWGINSGVLMLPFALVLFLFFIVSKFLNIGYADIMQNNLIMKIFALSTANLGLFYAFYFFSIWTGRLFYNLTNPTVLFSYITDWENIFYVFVLTFIYLVLFELINNYKKRNFNNV